MTADTVDTFDAMQIHPGIALYVGQRLRVLRLLSGMHQRDLAEKIGVHGSMVNLWEQDYRPMPHERIDAVAAALGTTPANLLKQVVKRLYPVYKRDVGMGEFVVSPQPETARRLPETVPPSARPSQLWCSSSHGTYVRRLHHHGYAPAFGPGVGRIDL